MRSATERLPRSRILLTTWVTSTEWYTGSGINSRRGAGPLRGMARLSLPLRAVAAAGLLAVADAGGVERAADDLVANAGEVLHTTAADEHDRVLLEVVALARDVGGDLHAAREPHTRDLAQRRVRLLRRVRVDACAHAPPLGRSLQRGRLGLGGLRLPTLADQLLDRGHGGSRIVVGAVSGQPRSTHPPGLGQGAGDRYTANPSPRCWSAASSSISEGATPAFFATILPHAESTDMRLGKRACTASSIFVSSCVERARSAGESGSYEATSRLPGGGCQIPSATSTTERMASTRSGVATLHLPNWRCGETRSGGMKTRKPCRWSDTNSPSLTKLELTRVEGLEEVTCSGGPARSPSAR